MTPRNTAARQPDVVTVDTTTAAIEDAVAALTPLRGQRTRAALVEAAAKAQRNKGFEQVDVRFDPTGQHRSDENR